MRQSCAMDIIVRGVLACSERASLPMLPPVASVPSPPTLQPAPQHMGDEMAHGHTGGWLLAAESISAGETTRPPEIIIIENLSCYDRCRSYV